MNPRLIPLLMGMLGQGEGALGAPVNVVNVINRVRFTLYITRLKNFALYLTRRKRFG